MARHDSARDDERKVVRRAELELDLSDRTQQTIVNRPSETR
jgi:hypothetical protein